MFNGLKVAEGESDKQLRPMDRTDWMAFAGAEPFEDGSEPLIAWVDVTEWPPEYLDSGSHPPVEGVAVIADRHGVAVNGENAAFAYFGADKEQAIEIANKIVQSAPVNYQDLVRQGFEAINFPNDDEINRGPVMNQRHELEKQDQEGRIPQNASAKTAEKPNYKRIREQEKWENREPDPTARDFAYKTESTTPDGYEIQSYSPYGDPGAPRRFTVWPPKGNAVGNYASLEEANLAIQQWKERGDPKLLTYDGGADFKVQHSSEGWQGQRHMPSTKVRNRTTEDVYNDPHYEQASTKTAGPQETDPAEQRELESGRKPMNASAKIAGSFDLTNSPSDYGKPGPNSPDTKVPDVKYLGNKVKKGKETLYQCEMNIPGMGPVPVWLPQQMIPEALWSELKGTKTG